MNKSSFRNVTLRLFKRGKPRSAHKLAKILLSTLLALGVVNAAVAELSFESFGKLPDVSGVSLSPDGEKVASIVRFEHEGRKGTVLHLVNLITKKKKILLSTDNSKFVLGWIHWANDSTLLASTHYPAKIYRTPVTATRLMRVDINTGEAYSAIPIKLLKRAEFMPTVQDSVIDFLPNEPDELLVSLRTSQSVASEVYRVNHKTKRYKRVHRLRSQTFDWITDQQHTIRIARFFDDTTVRYDHRLNKKAKWETLFEYDVFSTAIKEPLGFDTDSNVLYFRALHEGRNAIFKMNIATPSEEPELVFSDPQYDVNGSLIYSKKDRRVIGVRQSYGEGYIFWDKAYSNLQIALNRALPDTNNQIIEFSRDERRALVLSSSDTEAGIYFYWDRDAGSMSPVAYRYKSLHRENMTEKQYIDYSARDGLQIHGYLTIPNANATPGPTIVFPHGGPISYNGLGFDYWTQYFASKGYNVLQMNFRGSSGYGHDFMKAGLKDWGGKMQTDVEDGTRWLIAEGIADPNKICVVGASYGGYAALMEAANNSELYQCAVSFAGVTDLRKLVADSRKYINHDVVKEQIGSESKVLKARSPTNRAADIDVPVLLVQGTKDLSVPVIHGRRMHRKLQQANKDVKYVELEDGTHYLSNEEHRLTFFKEMDAFLDKHLQ